ncbi:M24 family metallopeptidase [Streptomyces yaizuensis]|uniref:Aminopeptidase P family protein n=1 Tax=Streptomyces yaizuensis TaxID=2989713 RepID=A0ABQ5P5Q6_9ACTN|nr:M24 family metallopeptidase [Streptomyces sp. YSPA8]GLF97820.1 aminopeptidase P family protein [Streptomyces sp. YSPA8]
MPTTPPPFTADDYRARMDRAALAAADAGFAGVLVAPGPDLVHLTGHRVPADTERLTLLVLAPGRDPVLVVPALEAGEAAHAPAAPALTLRDWTDGRHDPYALTAPLLDAAGRYAVSDNLWALHLLGLRGALPGTDFAALSDALPMLRAVKDARELERLAAAGAAADAAYREVLRLRFAGRTERDVARDLADLLRRFGHEQVDFTIVGSGPNGADPHHEAGERTIRHGDMVVMDFGGLKDGYGSDTTRTVHVGEPSPAEQHIHDVVREAQQAGVDAVRPGVACQDVDRAAREIIEAAGYGDLFIHRTGHGIGVTTHEPPYMVEGEKQPLVPGMCFSVEPGIYLPGRFGVRIEDIVAVTEDGGRRLNTTDRALAVVE